MTRGPKARCDNGQIWEQSSRVQGRSIIQALELPGSLSDAVDAIETSPAINNHSGSVSTAGRSKAPMAWSLTARMP